MGSFFNEVFVVFFRRAKRKKKVPVAPPAQIPFEAEHSVMKKYYLDFGGDLENGGGGF